MKISKWDDWQQAIDERDALIAERDALRAENEALRHALEGEREMARRREYPEPFRVKAVYATRDDVRYMLPIIHQWNEWPYIALEVGWIAAAKGKTP